MLNNFGPNGTRESKYSYLAPSNVLPGYILRLSILTPWVSIIVSLSPQALTDRPVLVLKNRNNNIPTRTTIPMAIKSEAMSLLRGKMVNVFLSSDIFGSKPVTHKLIV